MDPARTGEEWRAGKANYFDAVASRLDRPERLEAARRQGRKTIAVIGATVPEPLLWACGAAPIVVDRLATAGWVADRLPNGRKGRNGGRAGKVVTLAHALARDACAVSRTAFDLLANGWIPARLIDAVVVATTCDWSARMATELATLAPVWLLHSGRTAMASSLSTRQAAGTKKSIQASLESMLAAVELFTDSPLNARAFAEHFEQARRIEALFRRLDALRSAAPARLRASEYYRALGALDLADPEEWIRAVEALAANSERQAPRGPANPRVVLCGSPTGFPDDALVRAIEGSGLQIVGEGFSLHPRASCGENAPSGRRAILRWAASAVVGKAAHEGLRSNGRTPFDGVIWVQYRGCAVGAMEAATRMDGRTPTLIAEIEHPSPIAESLRTRLEAFRERLMQG